MAARKKRIKNNEESALKVYNPLGRPESTPEEKAMATHSSLLAWKIPWMEERGRLQSMGLLRVGKKKRKHAR